jgi:archaeosortase A (PGF-CTERM-specific)
MLDRVLAPFAWATQLSDPLAWVVITTFTAGVLSDSFDLDRRTEPMWTTVLWALLCGALVVMAAVFGVRQGDLVAAAVVLGALPVALGVAHLVLSAAGGRRDPATYLTVGAWVLFALFWASLLYHFAFVQKSIVEGVGVLVAVPASSYVAVLLARGRESLFVLSRAVALMGLVYLPFEMFAVMRRPLIEMVTAQTAFLMEALGQSPSVVTGDTVTTGTYEPFRNTFAFQPEQDYRVTYTIVLACTGIGSMAIFVGLIGAVRAPLNRKLRAFAVSIPVIYALNLVRNVFIGLSFGQMRMQFLGEEMAALFSFSLASDPALVSYYWSDRILAQTGSVIALVVITWLVIRELPEVLVVVEDLLYILTGSEYDLQAALGVSDGLGPDGRPVRADGK